MDNIIKIREFAYEQWINYDELEEKGVKLIGFEYKGQFIINPWIDSSGRFTLTDEQSIELYGKENFDWFINEYKEKIGGNK